LKKQNKAKKKGVGKKHTLWSKNVNRKREHSHGENKANKGRREGLFLKRQRHVAKREGGEVGMQG